MNLFPRIRNTLYKAFVKLMENAMSKKLLIFITSTVMLCYGIVPPEIWLPVALAALGIEGVLNYKEGHKSFDKPELRNTTGPPEIP